MAADDSAAAAREVVGSELERVVRRWQQLPLDHALSHVPRVRTLVQALADEVAIAQGLPRQEVPDLGPAVLAEQLKVMVFDHQQACLPVETLAAELTVLRRAL